MTKIKGGRLRGFGRAGAYATIAFFTIMIVAHLTEPCPLFRTPISLVALDNRGGLISARIAKDGQWRFEGSDTVPYKFERCILTCEDRKFHYHWGVDPMAMARATLKNIAAGHVVEGGSTITMQVARMAGGNRSRTWWQKIVETLWAIDIEFSHSKGKILSLYSSHAPFGGNVVGLEAASWRYFGRRAEDLSWAESTLLAVLPNSPSRIHVSRNRPLLLAKRDRLLVALCAQGDMDSTELELALSEPLPDTPFAIEGNSPQLMQRLAEESHDGATIRTTIDADLQRQAQAVADSYRARYAHNHIYDIGILVADVGSGYIRAYVGNASQKSATCMVDMLRAERSTGSILKPMLYAAMLSAGEITPKRLIADTPIDINGFTPQNYSHSYSGAVGADEAIVRSLNVPLVRMLTEHNVGRFMADLRQLGMTTLHFSDEHYGASIILGGAEATLTDVCGMYASMARRLNTYNADARHGDLSPTDCITALRLTDTPPSFPTPQASATPLSPAAIWHTFSAMADLARPEEEADWQSFSSMRAVAWKTGTSYGSRDAWAVGVTPRHVVGVWVGNATGEGRAGMTGVGFAAPVMFDVFGLTERGEAATWFEEPVEDEEDVAICRKSGMKATDICAEVDTVRLPREAAATRACTYCRLAHLTADGKWQVNSSCESTKDIVTRPWFVLPPGMAYYYSRHHSDYSPLPPMRPDCGYTSGRGIELIYPQEGQTVIRTRSFDGVSQGVVCEAAAPLGKRIFWHLDNEYIGETEGDHVMAIKPERGRHTMAIVSEDGGRATVNFKVE